MKPVVAARPGETVRCEPDRTPERAEIREAILGRARDLSAGWRAAWREAWTEETPAERPLARRA